MKMVQVFLKTGEGVAEISGELIRHKVDDSGVWITSQEGTSVTINFVPHVNLDFIRIFEEKDED